MVAAHLMVVIADILLEGEFFMATYYVQKDILTLPSAVQNERRYVFDAGGQVDLLKLENTLLS